MWYNAKEKQPFSGHYVLIRLNDEDGSEYTSMGFYAAENSITMEFDDISYFRERQIEFVSGSKGYEFYFPEGWFSGTPTSVSTPINSENIIAWCFIPKWVNENV